MFRERGRLGIVIVVAVFAYAGAVALSSAQTVYVEVGDVKTSFGTGIKPKALPASKRVPIAARVFARVRSKGTGHIPAIARATIGIDRGISIDARGVPTCAAAQLESQTSEGAEAACGPALVGSGTAALEIALGGGAPVGTVSRLLAFNGGVAGRTTTILAHAYISSPMPQALVVPIALTRLTKGGYGLRALATIPKIAGGAGSVARFDLTMRRQVATVSGGRHGYLLARCSDGNLVFEPEVIFENGSLARGLLAQGCDTRR